MSNTAIVITTTPTSTKVELCWKLITKEMLDSILRTISDKDTETPVRTLYLMENHLGPYHTQKICSALEGSQVAEIILRYNDIGKEGCDGLAAVLNVSSKVEMVDINGNHVSASDVRKLWKAVSTSISLRALCVASNNLGPEGASALQKALEKNTYLTWLDLSLNEVGPSGACAIASLIADPASALTKINLYGNHLNAAGVQALCAALKTNRTVKWLGLGNNNATDAVCSDFAEMLESNHTLEELDIRLNEITAEGAIVLATQGLTQNNTLTTITFSGNHVEASGAEEIAKVLLQPRTSLQTLDLSSCSLGPLGGIRFAGLIASSTTLKTLNLHDNQLDDEAAVALSRCLMSNTSLTSVDLSCNAIGEAGAANLLDAAVMNTRLVTMNLHGNDVNRVVPRKLAKLFEERKNAQKEEISKRLSSSNLKPSETSYSMM